MFNSVPSHEPRRRKETVCRRELAKERESITVHIPARVRRRMTWRKAVIIHGFQRHQSEQTFSCHLFLRLTVFGKCLLTPSSRIPMHADTAERLLEHWMNAAKRQTMIECLFTVGAVSKQRHVIKHSIFLCAKSVGDSTLKISIHLTSWFAFFPSLERGPTCTAS